MIMIGYIFFLVALIVLAGGLVLIQMMVWDNTDGELYGKLARSAGSVVVFVVILLAMLWGFDEVMHYYRTIKG